MQLDEDEVLTWLRTKSDQDFFDFVYRAAEGRGPEPGDSVWCESHVVLGHACRDKGDPRASWRVELVALPSMTASSPPDDHLCEAGSHCDHDLISWAKDIRCPVCGEDTYGT